MAHIVRLTVLIVLSLILNATNVEASMLWGVGPDERGGWNLYQISPTNASVSATIPFASPNFLNDVEVYNGKFYSLGLQGFAPGAQSFIQINPTFGTTTILKSIVDFSVGGLAVDPATGVFYSMKGTIAGDPIREYDVHGTLLGTMGMTGPGAILGTASDLAINPASGTLYADYSFNTKVTAINLHTGVATIVGDFPHSPFDGLAFDTENGMLYGITAPAFGFPFTGGASLYQINPANGSATFVGNLPTGTFINGLAFQASTPEPSTSVLLALGLVTGILIRRRQVSPRPF
jgi:hypothetical protein